MCIYNIHKNTNMYTCVYVCYMYFLCIYIQHQHHQNIEIHMYH